MTRHDDYPLCFEDATGTAAVSLRRGPLASGRFAHLALIALYALLVALYLCATANAKPTQEDVFRSIQDNVSESNDSSGMIILFICGGGAVLLVIALVGKRQQRADNPKALNHPGKLLKELRSSVSLKKAEIKQLRTVAETTSVGNGEPLASPLVLLLCPSVLAKVVQDKNSRVDRTIIARVIRRISNE